MAAHLEGEEKDLKWIKMLIDGPPKTNKAISS